MGVRAAQDGQVGHRLKLDVVEVAALAGDEAWVLGPLDRLAEGAGGGVEYVGHRRDSPSDRGWGRCPIAHGRGGGADGRDDVVVTGTAADVAGDGVPDLVVGRVAVAGQQVGGGHDHARGAEAALQAVLLPERGLERMERVLAGGHALDRGDGGAVGLDGEDRARLHGSAVEVDGAGAALTRVAPDVGAREVHVLAQGLDEQASRLDIEFPLGAVDGEGDVFAHGPDLLRTTTCRVAIAGHVERSGPLADMSHGSAGGGPMVAPSGGGIKSRGGGTHVPSRGHWRPKRSKRRRNGRDRPFPRHPERWRARSTLEGPFRCPLERWWRGGAVRRASWRGADPPGHVLERRAEPVDHRVDLALRDHERRGDVQGVAAQDARGDAMPSAAPTACAGIVGSRGQPLRVDGHGRRQPDGPHLPDDGQCPRGVARPHPAPAPASRPGPPAPRPRGCRGLRGPRRTRRHAPSTCSRGRTSAGRGIVPERRLDAPPTRMPPSGW